MAHITLYITDDQFSDLFFNYDHPEYDKIDSTIDDKNKEYSDKLYAAIVKDAKSFLKTVNLHEVYAEYLANDFFKRL